MTTEKTPMDTDSAEVSPEVQAAREQAEAAREEVGATVTAPAEKMDDREQASRAAEQTATAQLRTVQQRAVTVKDTVASTLSERVDQAARRLRSLDRPHDSGDLADLLLAVTGRRSRVPLIAGAAGLLIIAVVVRRSRR